LKDQDVEWLLSILNQRRETIVNGAIENRGNKLSKEGQKLLEDGHPILGKDAVGHGIIDLAVQPDVYFHENLPKHHIDIVKQNWK
jgi:hypothetical protein